MGKAIKYTNGKIIIMKWKDEKINKFLKWKEANKVLKWKIGYVKKFLTFAQCMNKNCKNCSY